MTVRRVRLKTRTSPLTKTNTNPTANAKRRNIVLGRAGEVIRVIPDNCITKYMDNSITQSDFHLTQSSQTKNKHKSYLEQFSKYIKNKLGED